MIRHFGVVPVLTIITLASTIALADQGNGNGAVQPKMFGKGNPFTVDDLPPGRTRGKLESLPEPARREALEWLHRFDFPANDLDAMVIDEEGAVLYVDPAPTDLPLDQAPAAEGTLPEASASAADDAFWLHSRPGAPNIVYLDFDGHSFSGTAWSSGTIHAEPFDLDGNPSAFSDAERNAIAEIWHRVAEDFAAFDIDVTTEEPASFGPQAGRVLITSRTDANGGTMPYGTAGGVAYINVWGRGDYASYYSPALVYYDNLQKNTTYIAEACAHEFGHNLGLSHDGTGSVTYYAGHGSGATSWAPIMGNSYYNNVTQWSSGEYAGANNTQDDLAVIDAKLSLMDDDHGDTLNSASPMVVDGSGEILVSNPETDPHNAYSGNKGVIEESGDQDLFYFNAAAGQVDLSVIPAWDAFYRTSKRGANLDIQASLLNAGGATLATSDPASETDASLSASVPAGTYYLAVTGVGNGNYSDYASAGQYFISGSIVPGDNPMLPPTVDFAFGCTNLICDFDDLSSDSDGSIIARSWDFGDGTPPLSALNPSHTYASTGTYSVNLTVEDNDGLTTSVSKDVSVTEPVNDQTPPAVTITSPGDGASANRRVTLSASATDTQSVVAQVSIYTDGNLRCSGTSSASCSWNLRNVADGEHAIEAKATDAAGNRASTSVTLIVGGSSGDDGGGGGSKGNKGKKK